RAQLEESYYILETSETEMENDKAEECYGKS
ncbi:unnamed protein product, partial [marine sediment metagenome]